MMNQHESIPDLMQEDTFEVVMRGYNRRQVHDYIIRTRNQTRDLEERLARAIEQAEQGRIELAEARRRMVETPQSYEDLSPRLAQILRLGEEEAAAKREDAETEAAGVRESAKNESERLVTSARETADKILTSSQAEAERRVGEATQAAERMLAQAGSDSEEQLSSARAEAEETVREARAEAERMVTGARTEAEQLMQSASVQAEQVLGGAHNEAETMLTTARQRTAALDEQAGRRVEYLSNTHTEVVRRLTEIGSVLGDLMRAESNAGPLVPEAIAPPQQGGPAAPAVPAESAEAPEQPDQPEAAAQPEPVAPQEIEDPERTVRVIVKDDAAEPAPKREGVVSDDTDVNIVRLSEAHK